VNDRQFGYITNVKKTYPALNPRKCCALLHSGYAAAQERERERERRDGEQEEALGGGLPLE